MRGERPADLLDQVWEYRAAYGEWPDTWMAFCHGIAHLARAASAEKLRVADAVAAHKQKAADFRQWLKDTSTLAGR